MKVLTFALIVIWTISLAAVINGARFHKRYQKRLISKPQRREDLISQPVKNRQKIHSDHFQIRRQDLIVPSRHWNRVPIPSSNYKFRYPASPFRIPSFFNLFT